MPLVTPCPECGDFDCLFPTNQEETKARCQSCGAEVVEYFPFLPGEPTIDELAS